MTGNIVYTIYREGSCMGFIPLPGKYTILDEAKLRVVRTLQILRTLDSMFYLFMYISTSNRNLEHGLLSMV